MARKVIFERDLVDNADGERLRVVGASTTPTRAWAPSYVIAQRANGEVVTLPSHDVEPFGKRFRVVKPEQKAGG